MSTTFDRRSNIFGEITSSSSSPTIPYVTTETSQAGQLIDKLKNIADNELLLLGASVDWLGLAANQGQNGDPKGFVQYQNVKPDHVSNSNILAGSSFAMPTLPSLPALPSGLVIDMNPFKANVNQLITDLQNSWMAKFLPASTDTSKYDTLMKDILNGTDDQTTTALLNSYFVALQSDLGSVKTTALNDIVAQIATMYANLTAAIGGIQPKIDAAIATAQDNTSNIVFARGRDQIAREGAREEAEAIADWASRGWSMPGGPLAAAQSAARERTLEASSKIAAEQSTRVQQMNIDLAKISIDTWSRTAELQLRANLDGMRQALEARIRFSQFQLDADRVVCEQAVKNLGLRLDFSKFGGEFALKYRTSAIEGMNGLVNAYAALTRNEMEYYEGIANAQRANVLALVEYFRAALAYSDIGVRVGIANVEADTRWAEVAGSFIGRAAANHVQAASATGNMYAQVAGMALGGLNGVASATVQSSS